MARARHINS